MCNEGGSFLGGLILGALALFLGFWAAGITPRAGEKEAVKQGHARYYLDENNEKTFEWLAPCAVKPMELPCGMKWAEREFQLPTTRPKSYEELYAEKNPLKLELNLEEH